MDRCVWIVTSLLGEILGVFAQASDAEQAAEDYVEAKYEECLAAGHPVSIATPAVTRHIVQ